MPLFGICLGQQLLALSLGGQTSNEVRSSRSNHPVQDLKTQKVAVSSVNHGFTVDEDTLPEELRILISHYLTAPYE